MRIPALPADNRGLRVVGYLFSSLAFMLFVYAFFFEEESSIRAQAIYWFFGSLVAALTPNVKQFKFKDVEVAFEGIREEISDVRRKVAAIEENFFTGADRIRIQEQYLTTEELEKRKKSFDANSAILRSLSPGERLFEQERATRYCLFDLCLTIATVKRALHDAGFYDGEIDDNFDQGFVDSVAAFQKDQHLDQVDGIYGRLTHQALARILKDKMNKRNLEIESRVKQG